MSVEGIRNGQTEGIVNIPSIPAVTGETSGHYLNYLYDTLRAGGNWSEEQIEELQAIQRIVNEDFEQSEKAIRFSGDNADTHFTLTQIAMAAFAGIDGEEEQIAAALHDWAEDIKGVTLEKVEETAGSNVREYANVTTKVSLRSGKDRNGTEIDEEQLEQEEQTRTEEKIYQGLIDRVKRRGLYIKLFDIWHNMRTIQFDPEEDRRERKAKRALVLASLAKKLGFDVLYRQIGADALQVLESEELNTIRQLREEIVTENMISTVQTEVENWTQTGIINRRNLEYVSYTVESPADIDVYNTAKTKRAYTKGDVLPCIKIVCHNNGDVIDWYNFLSQEYNFTPEEEETNPFSGLFNSEPIKKQITIETNGQVNKHTVILTTSEIEAPIFTADIMPEMLTEKERKFAEKKLSRLQNAYKRAVLAKKDIGDVTTDMRDLLEGETILIRGKEEFLLPDGATALDYAFYSEEPELAVRCKSVTVKRGTDKVTLQPEDKIEEGDVVVETEWAEEIEPEMVRGYDKSITRRAHRNLQRVLETKKGTPELDKAADTAGREIILQLYQMLHPEGDELEIFIVDGFDQELKKRYKNIMQFTPEIGYIPLPFSKSNLELWEQQCAQIPEVCDTFKLVLNLLQQESSRTVGELELGDRKGVVGHLGRLAADMQVNIMPIKGTPDHQAPDLNRREALVQVGLSGPDADTLLEYEKTVREKYEEMKIKFTHPK